LGALQRGARGVRGVLHRREQRLGVGVEFPHDLTEILHEDRHLGERPLGGLEHRVSRLEGA